MSASFSTLTRGGLDHEGGAAELEHHFALVILEHVDGEAVAGVHGPLGAVGEIDFGVFDELREEDVGAGRGGLRRQTRAG